MNALCINEKTEIEYKSTIENRMHACRHDAHTSRNVGRRLYFKKIRK